jgi:hypothetical protein
LCGMNFVAVNSMQKTVLCPEPAGYGDASMARNLTRRTCNYTMDGRVDCEGFKAELAYNHPMRYYELVLTMTRTKLIRQVAFVVRWSSSAAPPHILALAIKLPHPEWASI